MNFKNRLCIYLNFTFVSGKSYRKLFAAASRAEDNNRKIYLLFLMFHCHLTLVNFKAKQNICACFVSLVLCACNDHKVSEVFPQILLKAKANNPVQLISPVEKQNYF